MSTFVSRDYGRRFILTTVVNGWAHVVPLVVHEPAGDRLMLYPPGALPEYPNGLALISGSAWAAQTAHNIADAYRPEVP